MNAGRLNINNSGSLGTSTLDLIGGDIDNTSGAPITLSTNNAQNWGENISFLGTNNLNLGTGNIIRNATTTITTNGTGTLTIGGIISGNWGLIKSGNGALTLDGVNTHTGKTILNAGTLNMSQSANIGTGIYEQNNGSLNIYGNNIINKILNISGGTIDIYDNTIFSGTINLSQGLAVNFHNNSYNKGIVNGNAKFSFADGGIASLTGTKVWGTVTGTAKGLLDDVVINHWVFNDSSYGNGTTTISQGKVMDFYDTSSNTGNLFVTAGGIVSFHDSSFNNGGNISVASGGTVHFYDSSFNVGGVSDVASGGLFDFYNYSFNNGVVNGNVVFNDDVSQNVGLINGSTTRQYNTDATTTRNFTNEGGHNDWIVIVQGVILDISNAIYSLVTNIFKSFNNGFFFFGSNSSGGPVIPQIIINQPLVGTSTIKWLPSVDWGNGTSTCQYKMDDGEYQNLDCSKNGSDISRPIAGMHTLFVRATDIKGNLTEKSIIFTYDNTVPVYTSCGTDLLDEETRPYYYLSSDIANDCHITVDTELRGGNFTIDGNVIANATSSGADGFDITISNITITGTTSAMGGDNNNGNGGNGGNITIATSTTGSVTTKGGNANLDGGHGGNISIINSRSNNSDNTIITNGGDSLSCGNGGNGGLVNIINSSYGLVTNSGGLSSQIGCSGSNKQPGSSGQINTVGAGYIPPYNPNDALSEADTLSRNSINKTQPAGSSNVLFNMLNNIIDPFTYKDIKQINPFAPDFKTSNLGNTVIPAIFKNFKTVPYVYFEQLTSMLLMNISKFLFTARPESVDYLINNNPELAKYLKLSSIKNEQDLVTLSTKNILLAKTDTENIPKGLFVIKSSGKDVPTYLTYNKDVKSLSQLIKVSPGEKLYISIVPQNKEGIKGSYLGKDVIFDQGSSYINTYIKAPLSTGRYVFKTNSSPLTLLIDVTVVNQPVKIKTGFWNWLSGLFK